MFILYLLVLVITLAFYILYEGTLSFIIFVFSLALPIFLVILNAAAKHFVKVTIKTGAATASVGEDIPLEIVVENRSVIPVPSAEICLALKFTSGGTTDKLKICTPLFPANKQTLTSSFAANHCGMLVCRLESVRLCDMLRISRFKLTRRSLTGYSQQIVVLPEAIPLVNEAVSYNGMGLESDEFSADKAGDDPSEVFGIHEYADGDKLSRIHWKLTAKTGDVMVKDYSLPLAESCLILTEFYLPPNSKQADKLYDSLVQLSFSISMLLVNCETRHRSAVYDEKSGTLVQTVITDEQSLIENAAAQLSCGVCSRENAGVQALLGEQTETAKYQHLIYICTSFSQSAADSLEICGLAHRYTVLLIYDGKEIDSAAIKIPDTQTDIIPVDCRDIANSISELII